MGTERGREVGAKCSITEEKKKYHGYIRNIIVNMIVASSHVLSLSPKGDTQGVYSAGLFLFPQEQIKNIIR
jgi:hypothetical protein